jgi:bifunctional non-homologous end joining protein LigD
MGVLEFHVWGSHVESLEYPDQIVFDFDPDPALPFSRVVDGARLMRIILEDLGLRSFVKTTGGKGLHVVTPILPTRRWDEVKPVTKAIAEALVRADPGMYIATMSLKKRAGKIFVDYLRNGRGATFISAFSTRRHPGAPVAAPLRWDELGPGLRADRYTVGTMRSRLARLRDDPWRGYDELRQEITPETEQAADSMFTLPA